MNWDITQLQPLDRKNIFSGYYNNQPIILKTGENVIQEAHALIELKEHCVKLLDYDEHNLVLERIFPGSEIKELDEIESTVIANEIVKKLHSRQHIFNYEFPTLNDWFQALIDKAHLIPEIHKNRAVHTTKWLLETTLHPVLLHGDLHHENILLDQKRGWVVIDPKGVIGDPAYEYATWLINPLEMSHTFDADIINRRIQIFSKSADANRIRAWAYVNIFLRAIWNIEDDLDPDLYIKLADLFVSNNLVLY